MHLNQLPNTTSLENLTPQLVCEIFKSFYDQCRKFHSFGVSSDTRQHVRHTRQVGENNRTEWRSPFTNEQRVLVIEANKEFTRFLLAYFSKFNSPTPSIDLYELIDLLLREFIDYLEKEKPLLLIPFRAAFYFERMIGLINLHEVIYDVVFNARTLNSEDFMKTFHFNDFDFQVEGISTCPFESSSVIVARNITNIKQDVGQSVVIRKQPINCMADKDNYERYITSLFSYLDEKIRNVLNK